MSIATGLGGSEFQHQLNSDPVIPKKILGEGRWKAAWSYP
jgi:hypothetical protein